MEVTYEYYQDNYGGSRIPESRWKTLETKMRARLNRYTFDRMSENNWPEQAKQRCVKCVNVRTSMKNRMGKRQKIMTAIL